MQIEMVPITDLVPYANNPRRNARSVAGVASSIREFGFKIPMVIDQNNTIVCGHTRYEASKKLGMEEVPCVRVDDLTEDQINAFRLADNKVAETSKWDVKKLQVELSKIQLDMRPFNFGRALMPKVNERQRTMDTYHLDEYDEDNAQGFFQMPIIRRTNCVVDKLIGFNYVLNSPAEKGAGVHFYLDDYQFERLWTSPYKYIDKLQEYDCVLTPDFSLYLDMPMALKVYNVYRSRLLGQIMQNMGVVVVPTLQWAEPATFSFCFDGLEPNGVYSVSTIGVKRNEYATKIWTDGMDEAIKVLQPKTILCYGGDIGYAFPCEVVYITNEVTKKMKGR